jgi:outer membrane scaffolding protein for murein synthesis (MipA/OmpV family)
VARGLAIGAQVAYEAAGKTLDWGASVGAHVEWDTKIGPAPFNLLARYRQNVDTDRGAEADLRATVGVYGSGPWQAGVFTQATWGSSKWSNAYYGVSGSGLAYASVGLLGSYDLNRQWLIVGSAEARSLQGDVKDSPIVDRRTGYYVSGGLAYRF